MGWIAAHRPIITAQPVRTILIGGAGAEVEVFENGGAIVRPGAVEGSISMGLGMALQENFVMQEGYIVTDTLFKCKLPTIDQTPEVTTFFVKERTQDGPYGAKGVGELASIPTAPAIINAIYHATGVRRYSLPADKKW